MQYDPRAPFFHARRLREAAAAANCPGVVALIDYQARLLRDRKKNDSASTAITGYSSVAFQEDPVVGAAIDHMNEEIERRFGEKEKAIETRFAKDDEDDC